MTRALAYLEREQEADGSWFGRWGTNYIYGTWSVLCALNAAGMAHDNPMIRRAVNWLLSVQREDGGWGEDEESYADAPRGRYKQSTPSQTAWALLGLMAAGEAAHPAVARGVAWLISTQRADGEWEELPYTAVGFPRVFYLRYHGYKQFFPLLAMARYRNLQRANTTGWRLDSRSIGVVVGMRAEARLLRRLARRLGFRVAIGGGTPAGAEAAARRLVADGALGLVSFGLAGGLHPRLRRGRTWCPAKSCWSMAGISRPTRNCRSCSAASRRTPFWRGACAGPAAGEETGLEDHRRGRRGPGKRRRGAGRRRVRPALRGPAGDLRSGRAPPAAGRFGRPQVRPGR